MKNPNHLRSIALGFAAASLFAQSALATQVTLLATSDLHSHYRPDTDETRLGGLARLKTAIDKIRKTNPNTLLADGGDWSEGQLYYAEGTGREILKLMDTLTYDAAVVGNHDWLNGPDALLDAARSAQLSRLSLVAANVDTGSYARKKEFGETILPYAIKKVGDVKVAFIGLVTWEFIYDRWLSPIKIEAPFDRVRTLVKKLKPEVDAIVVISHNGQKLNEQVLAKNPEVDVVVGAHDHRLLLKPTAVDRGAGKQPSWLIHTGKWGKYLGKLEMNVLPRAQAEAEGKPSVELLSYEALPIDARYKEDAAIAKVVDQLEARIVQEFGDVFHDHVADSEILVQDRPGGESLLGNLAADAYVKATGADLSIESNGFLYSELQPGAITSSDVFNSNPGVFQASTRKTWPVRVVPMRGITLQWLLGALFSNDQFAAMGGLSASGVDVIYGQLIGGGGGGPAPAEKTSFNPFTFFMGSRAQAPAPTLAAPAFPNVVSIQVGGKPLNLLKTYQVALSGGGYSAIEFINSWVPGAVPTSGMVDSGIESWRALHRYVEGLKTIRMDDVYQPGKRFTKKGPSIGFFTDDVTMEPLEETANGLWAKVSVRVRNFGHAASTAGATSFELFSNVGAFDTSVAVKAPGDSLAKAKAPGSIAPGSSETLVWEKVFIPKSALKPPAPGKKITAILVKALSAADELETQALESSRIWIR